MQISLTLISMLTLNVNAFTSYTKPIVNTFKFAGDVEPIGYFDPLQLSKNLDEGSIKYMREAELQHARVAMYSMILLPVLDILDKDHLAINKLSSMTIEEQLPYWIGAAAFECARMGAGWKNPFVTDGKGTSLFKLEDDYQPGNIFKLSDEMYDDNMLNKELFNGRLAMIGAAQYICQEYLTGQPIFH